MQFRVRDLAIWVIPEGVDKTVCQVRTRPCNVGTIVCRQQTFQCQRHTLCDVTLCRWGTGNCIPRTMVCPMQTCGIVTPACPGITKEPCGGISCAGGSRFDPGELDIEDLAILKRELQAELEEVEAAEQALSEQAQPQTVEELDELQSKLEGALEDLKQRRGEIG